MDGWVGGWKDGWVDGGRASLRIAYSNQKPFIDDDVTIKRTKLLSIHEVTLINCLITVKLESCSNLIGIDQSYNNINVLYLEMSTFNQVRTVDDLYICVSSLEVKF